MDKINLNNKIYSEEKINEITLAIKNITQFNCKKTQKFYINSQLIKKDSVFVVLLDYKIKPAYEYIENAIQNGAKLIITNYCEEKIFAKYSEEKILITKDTLNLLTQIAQYKRYLLSINNSTIVIGITGSTGKTSLKQYFNICSDIYTNDGNLNNHIGMPLSLASIDMDAKVAALELGMNKVGEINHLTNILKPEIAVITNISEAHIGNLNSIFQITKEKISIIDGLIGKKILILSQEAKYYEYMLNYALKNNCEVFSFNSKYISEDLSSDCYILNYHLDYNFENSFKKINSFIGLNNIEFRNNKNFLDSVNSSKNIQIPLHDLVFTKAKIVIFGVRINIKINKYIQKHILCTLLGGILCDIIVTCLQDLKNQNYYEYSQLRKYITNYIQRENTLDSYHTNNFYNFLETEQLALSNGSYASSKNIAKTIVQNTIHHTKLEQLINNKLNLYIIENGRGNIIFIKKFFNGYNCIIVNDSYNASFASMQSSLIAFDLLFSSYETGLHKQHEITEDSIGQFNHNLNIKRNEINNIRKVIILGDMLELGEMSLQLHKNLTDTILNIMPNLVILYGEHMKHLFLELKNLAYNIICLYFDNMVELKEYLSEHIYDNDFILLKGSKGTNLYKLLDNLN